MDYKRRIRVANESKNENEDESTVGVEHQH